MGRVLVVWPSLNEGATISDLVGETTDSFMRDVEVSNTELHFLIADDSQGADLALQSLAQRDSRVRVFTPTERLGHQRGLTAVLRHIRDELPQYDAVVTMDADGEDRPSDISRLVQPVLKDQVDLARAQRGKRNVHKTFSLGYLIYRALFRILTGLRITSGNFAAARGNWWYEQIQSNIWNLTFSGTLASVTGRVVDIPCDRDARREGKSRMNFSGLIGYGLMFALPFSLRIATRAAILTALASVLAVLMIITVIVLRLFTETSTPGWTTTVTFGAAGVTLIAFVALTSALVLYASTNGARSDSGHINKS